MSNPKASKFQVSKFVVSGGALGLSGDVSNDHFMGSLSKSVKSTATLDSTGSNIMVIYRSNPYYVTHLIEVCSVPSSSGLDPTVDLITQDSTNATGTGLSLPFTKEGVGYFPNSLDNGNGYSRSETVSDNYAAGYVLTSKVRAYSTLIQSGTTDLQGSYTSVALRTPPTSNLIDEDGLYSLSSGNSDDYYSGDITDKMCGVLIGGRNPHTFANTGTQTGNQRINFQGTKTMPNMETTQGDLSDCLLFSFKDFPAFCVTPINVRCRYDIRTQSDSLGDDYQITNRLRVRWGYVDDAGALQVVNDERYQTRSALHPVDALGAPRSASQIMGFDFDETFMPPESTFPLFFLSCELSTTSQSSYTSPNKVLYGGNLYFVNEVAYIQATGQNPQASGDNLVMLLLRNYTGPFRIERQTHFRVVPNAATTNIIGADKLELPMSSAETDEVVEMMSNLVGSNGGYVGTEAHIAKMGDIIQQYHLMVKAACLTDSTCLKDLEAAAMSDVPDGLIAEFAHKKLPSTFKNINDLGAICEASKFGKYLRKAGEITQGVAQTAALVTPLLASPYQPPVLSNPYQPPVLSARSYGRSMYSSTPFERMHDVYLSDFNKANPSQGPNREKPNRLSNEDAPVNATSYSSKAQEEVVEGEGEAMFRATRLNVRANHNCSGNSCFNRTAVVTSVARPQDRVRAVPFWHHDGSQFSQSNAEAKELRDNLSLLRAEEISQDCLNRRRALMTSLGIIGSRDVPQDYLKPGNFKSASIDDEDFNFLDSSSEEEEQIKKTEQDDDDEEDEDEDVEEEEEQDQEEEEEKESAPEIPEILSQFKVVKSIFTSEKVAMTVMSPKEILESFDDYFKNKDALLLANTDVMMTRFLDPQYAGAAKNSLEVTIGSGVTPPPTIRYAAHFPTYRSSLDDIVVFTLVVTNFKVETAATMGSEDNWTVIEADKCKIMITKMLEITKAMVGIIILILNRYNKMMVDGELVDTLYLTLGQHQIVHDGDITGDSWLLAFVSCLLGAPLGPLITGTIDAQGNLAPVGMVGTKVGAYLYDYKRDENGNNLDILNPPKYASMIIAAEDDQIETLMSSDVNAATAIESGLSSIKNLSVPNPRVIYPVQYLHELVAAFGGSSRNVISGDPALKVSVNKSKTLEKRNESAKVIISSTGKRRSYFEKFTEKLLSFSEEKMLEKLANTSFIPDDKNLPADAKERSDLINRANVSRLFQSAIGVGQTQQTFDPKKGKKKKQAEKQVTWELEGAKVVADKIEDINQKIEDGKSMLVKMNKLDAYAANLLVSQIATTDKKGGAKVKSTKGNFTLRYPIIVNGKNEKSQEYDLGPKIKYIKGKVFWIPSKGVIESGKPVLYDSKKEAAKFGEKVRPVFFPDLGDPQKAENLQPVGEIGKQDPKDQKFEPKFQKSGKGGKSKPGKFDFNIDDDLSYF